MGMMNEERALALSIAKSPIVFDEEAAARARVELANRLAGANEEITQFLSATASCAPYLERLMRRAPDILQEVISVSPEMSLEAAINEALCAGAIEPGDDAWRALRLAKIRAAMAIAFADIGGVWDVMTAARALSVFADAGVEGALRLGAQEAGLGSTDGVAALAMGKHGALELNYSSDIDLVVLFDRERMNISDRGEAQKKAVQCARVMVAALQSQTADGYVFRTDLRLRPDPGVSALAVSVAAAESYYEAYGQNWERMAYIKARVCAGDKVMGEEFLSRLRPFIWRKYLDFAAIEDVHAVKRQIHAVKGGGEVEFEGHDIKLGRGGIREIEFYVQTQQLILGGKDPQFRERATLSALGAFEQAGVIQRDTKDRLSRAYEHFRLVEHRLQMINDEQTHKLPVSAEEVDRLRCFLGEESEGAFRQFVLAQLRYVHQQYADLFETPEDASASNIPGSLVFTGVEDHPGTLETLSSLGFARGSEISAAIRRWHTGGLRATRTERARVLLTKLVPPLLQALSKAGNPDDAFFAFESFLRRLPAGVQVFSLLLNNLELFDALIRVMTISPYLARELSHRHNFIEKLLENRLVEPAEPPKDYDSLCAGIVSGATDFEAALNAVRRWAGEQKFHTTALLATGSIDYKTAAQNFSAIADSCIRALAPVVREEIRRMHGDIEGDFAIIGLGRLGAGEMTAVSDIDLTFVFDCPSDALSDGERQLSPVDYFGRYVRRLITALSAATEEGGLYEVDMQLRPSGRSGPTAVAMSAFKRYYDEEAWLWEVMALTKARVICGDKALMAAVSSQVDAIITRKREPESVAKAVKEMRDRLATAKPARGVWDVKRMRGGLTDIAFIAQYFLLLGQTERGTFDTRSALEYLAAKQRIRGKDADLLINAHSTYENVHHVGRAATGRVFSPEGAGDALRLRMARICGADTVDGAEAILLTLSESVSEVFSRLVTARAQDEKTGQQ